MAKTPALVLVPALSAVLLIFFAGALLIFAVNNRKISEWREELKSERRGMPVSDVEAIADDWAADFYGENDQVRINWETDFDTVEVGDEELVALIGATGPDNQDILLFIEVNKKKSPVGKKSIDHPHMKKYPFRYSDYYEEKKKAKAVNLESRSQR